MNDRDGIDVQARKDANSAARFLSLLGLAAVLSLSLRHPTFDGARMTEPLDDRTGVYRIDPRTASAATWTLVPGIGPATGRRLDRHRRAGGFDGGGPWDLEAVSGIGPVTARRAAPRLVHPSTDRKGEGRGR